MQRLFDYFKDMLPTSRSEDFKRSLRNAVYSSTEHLLHPVLLLISTPIFLYRLGTDQFGIWMLVNSMIGLSSFMEFGLTGATVKYVSKYRALQDEAGVIRVVRSTFTVYGTLGILASLMFCILAPLLVDKVFKIDKQNLALAVAVFQISAIGVAVRFFDGFFQSILHGYERYDLASRVTMITSALAIGVNVLLVMAGYGLKVILLSVFAWLLVSGACKALLIKRLLINSLVLKPTWDRSALKEIFGFGVFSWMQGVGGILLGQADRLLLASLLGTTALAYYAVCLQLAQQVHALLARATQFLFPLASAIKESGDLERLRRLYFQGLNLTTIAAVTIGLPMFVCAPEILSLWMGADFAAEATDILRVLVFVFTLMATSIVPYYYLNGTGYVALNTLFGLVSGGMVAIAGLLLIPWLGPVGAAWSRTANTPTGIISRTVLHYRVLSDKRWYAGMAIVLPVLLAFAAGLAFLKLLGEPGLSWFMLPFAAFAYALLGFVLASGCSLLLNFSNRMTL
jgi:O-antigen/teichoic acid export membrane protein